MLKNSYLFFIWFLLTVHSVNSQSNNALSILNDSVFDIGYGKSKPENISSSISHIDAEQFNSGINVTPIELIIGRVPGMLITRESGTPGSNFDVTIRGKSALFAYDNPLYVIDGIPLDHEQIDGMRNPLNFINPGDIESFTVLKDAAALAIYGGRAENGVILINTITGNSGKPLQINYETKLSISLFKKRETLSASDFRTLIETKYANDPQVYLLLGRANTDWQDAISINAFGQDHLLSLTGGINKLPYRVSVGYTNQDGVLKTDQFERFTTTININPRFFKDHLGISLGLKGMHVNNRFADPVSISGAIAFDPTQNIYDDGNSYGGYFYWKDESGNPLWVGPNNPLAELELTTNESVVNRILWNLGVDYKFHFLTELRIALKYSDDRTKSERNVFIPDYAPWLYDPYTNSGVNNDFNQEFNTRTYEALLSYNTVFKKINSSLDVLVGASLQSFEQNQEYQLANADLSTISAKGESSSTNDLASIFGRVNFAFKERYLISITFRSDGYSQYSNDNRWGNYPAASLGWNVHNEGFLLESNALSTLRLRTSYGKTGNMMINHYPFNLNFKSVNFTYDPNLKPESTTAFDVGLDFGFWNDRIYGIIDFYNRKTSDVIYLLPVQDGTNLTKYVLTNLGEMENKGVEFSLMTRPVFTNKLIWDIGVNFSYNENRINTPESDDLFFSGYHVGYISGGVGNTIQIHSPKYPAYSFFVYKQVYDDAGNPIEGVYQDLNNDGEIDSEDMYHYQTPAPSVFMGITSDLKVKNWNISFMGTLRIGNYVYNNIDSKYAAYRMISPMAGYLNSSTPDIKDTQFKKNQYLSDYYVQQASYFRLNYLNIGYDFTPLMKGKWGIRLNAIAQNLFTISAYSGPEPEISNGIDYNTYPSPRVFLLRLVVSLN